MSDSDHSEPFTVFGTEMTTCENCGEPMVGTRELCLECEGAVPIGVLEELVTTWENQRTGEWYTDRAFEQAAGELQERIDNYRNEQ